MSAAAEQIMAAESSDEPSEEIQAVLDWHGNDARAAIGTLLQDCGHLRGQLILADGAMGRGFTRG